MDQCTHKFRTEYRRGQHCIHCGIKEPATTIRNLEQQLATLTDKYSALRESVVEIGHAQLEVSRTVMSAQKGSGQEWSKACVRVSRGIIAAVALAQDPTPSAQEG